MTFWDSLPRPIIGLAPMDGVTDATFRALVAEQGRPDVIFTEFTHVNDLCSGPDFLVESLCYSEVERPIVAQLYGKDPELFYIAAHAVCELGFDGLDINMGCPSRHVASSGSGAGLIRTPDLARAVVRAARQGILDWSAGQTPEQAGLKPARADLLRTMNIARNGRPTAPRRVIPLSVKTRLGYDCVVIEDWIAHLVEERPAVITVHGRTLRQMYRGEADWNAIARAARIVSGSGTLLLGNGDVMSMQQVVRRVRESGVHGVLIGRGAMGAPWVFRTKDLAKRMVWSERDGNDRLHGALGVEVSVGERFLVMTAHARQFYARCGAEQFRRVRKHLGWYCKGFPGAAAMRAKMFQASSPADVERIVVEFAPAASVGRESRSDAWAHARSSPVLSAT
jgi:tRNA-dihydrouridine synthase